MVITEFEGKASFKSYFGGRTVSPEERFEKELTAQEGIRREYQALLDSRRVYLGYHINNNPQYAQL